MAAKYRKIDPRTWDDESFSGLSPGAKLIVFYILTAQSNRIGLFRYSHALAIEHTGINVSDSYQTAFRNVCDTLAWEYDPARRVMYIPTWWKYNAPENPKHLIGCLTDFPDVPQTVLAQRFWGNTAHLPENLWHTFREAKRKLFDSYGHSYPISEAETETGAEAENSDAPAARVCLAPGSAVPSPEPVSRVADDQTSGNTPPTPRTRQNASQPRQRPVDDSPGVLTFPTTGRGPAEWVLTERKLAEYGETFPHLDVLAQLRIARQWCIDNEANQKTARGMPAFLSRWLTNAQNRGGRPGNGDSHGPRNTGPGPNGAGSQNRVSLPGNAGYRHRPLPRPDLDGFGADRPSSGGNGEAVGGQGSVANSA